LSRSRRRLLRLLMVAVGLIAVVWTVHSLDPKRVWASAAGADPFWLTVSAIPIVLRFAIWGAKWANMLKRHEPVPLGLATRFIAAGSFVNLTTPTAKLAGGVVRAMLLNKRRGWRMSVAYGWAFADQVTNLLGHTLLFGVGSVAFSLHPAAGVWSTAFATIGVLTLLGLAVGVWIRRPAWAWIQRPTLADKLGRFVPQRFVGKEGITPGALQRIFGPLLYESASWKAFIPDVLLGALAFTALPVANAMVLRSLGVDAPLLVVTVVVVLGYLAGNLLGAWGGIGVTEVALAALGAQFGVPAEAAAAGALLHRAVFYTVVLSCGGASLWVERSVLTGAAATSHR
jgi:uncharacterized membrane protein YbhN (UPF0104 family)